ncbi:MAG: hypothetical protein DME18_00985 [Verrucomicrobia bacterium]|nr:MAG: hypothetical protein DME18_00985 [Verrucomicrobiota bacterium]
MGELESLLLVLALIYLSECMVWVRRGALAFRRWWGKNYRILHPGGLLANPRGGLLPANPLPPLGTVFVAQPFPLSLSPDAAFAYSSTCLNPAGRPSQTAGCLRFEDIRDVAVEGRNVLVNGEIFLKSISAFSARHLADGLRRLQKLPKPERAEAIKGLIRDSLNAGNIAGILRDCGSRAGPIRILSNALFFYLFFVVVPFVWRFGFGQLGLWLLGGMLPQTITIALLFRRAHQALYPGAGEERFKPFLTMLLAPPTAIRAPDILARHLLEQFHPLAIAQVLCPSDSFEHFARQVLLDLRYPLFPVCPTSDEAAVAVERGFRTAVREAVEKFIQCAGLRPEDLTAPRRPDEPANQSYCPRCGAQFVMREGRCADCGGRPLQSFKQIPTA